MGLVGLVVPHLLHHLEVLENLEYLVGQAAQESLVVLLLLVPQESLVVQVALPFLYILGHLDLQDSL